MPWLQPMPDVLFAAAPTDPATVVVQRQTMRLALVGALQQLPPRQRAVLILRDVLQWRTTEVAELLEMTTAAVNSALQRARAQVPLSEDGLTEPAEPRQRALLDRYVTAFETADVDQLVAVLTEDARWEMPPIATWFEGRDTILAFLARQMRTIGPAELVATAANGQPAFAVYARDHDGVYSPARAARTDSHRRGRQPDRRVPRLRTVSAVRTLTRQRMAEREHTDKHDAAAHAQLRLFCRLMLGSADAADCMIQQIYRRALDHHDEQENCPSERVQLFRIAAALCGARRQGRRG